MVWLYTAICVQCTGFFSRFSRSLCPFVVVVMVDAELLPRRAIEGDRIQLVEIIFSFFCCDVRVLCKRGRSSSESNSSTAIHNAICGFRDPIQFVLHSFRLAHSFAEGLCRERFFLRFRSSCCCLFVSLVRSRLFLLSNIPVVAQMHHFCFNFSFYFVSTSLSLFLFSLCPIVGRRLRRHIAAWFDTNEWAIEQMVF